jgi:xylitol oxidase
VEEVRDAVRTRGGRVRAIGTRHSFSDLADSDPRDGTLISLTALDPAPELDEVARTVTVGAGMRYGDVALWLEERGWALSNMGSLPHISVGGATATGTHGSGNALGTLSTAVRALEFVDAHGDLRRVAAAAADFAGYVVHLGAIGIVTRVTLAIEPSFRVSQVAYEGLPWQTLLADVGAVTGSAYSVSVFARWTEPTVTVVRKQRIAGGAGELPDEWLGARRMRRPIFDSDAWTDQTGTPGAWLHRLPHFRLEATPSVGEEIQSEYFVDRVDAADALRAVRGLGEPIDEHLVVTELRTMSADELWLSGAYGRDTLAIHFTWQPHPEAVRSLLPRIEEALRPFAARPHWGKWHAFDAERLAAVHPRLGDARALLARADPDGVFANAHLERLGLVALGG